MLTHQILSLLVLAFAKRPLLSFFLPFSSVLHFSLSISVACHIYPQKWKILPFWTPIRCRRSWSPTTMVLTHQDSVLWFASLSPLTASTSWFVRLIRTLPFLSLSSYTHIFYFLRCYCSIMTSITVFSLY